MTTRQLHIIGELLGLFVAAPFSIYMATRRELPIGLRVLNGVAGVGTAAIDGWLLAEAIRGPKLPGGRGAGKTAADFDPRQVAVGVRVELEHTPDPAIALEIALDHLSEDPAYYTKLCSMWPGEAGCELFPTPQP